MEAPLLLAALGTPVDVLVGGSRAAELRSALDDTWTLCRRDHPAAGARTLEVRLGEEQADVVSGDLDDPLVVGTELDRLLVEVTHRVTWQAVDAGVGSLLMLHAAGLADQRTGEAVVFVAPGGTGKTTICRTLGRGRGYLSDETVGVAADHTIRPYAKPLSVRRDHGGPGAEKDEVNPVQLGLAPTSTPARLHSLLLLDRHDDAPDDPVVAPLDLFDAIVGLAPETSSLSRLPQPLHRLADLLESTSLLARIHYREAASLESVVAGLIGPPLSVEAPA